MTRGDVAIRCRDVWKSYRVYHQRSHTLKEKVLSRRNRFDEFWALNGVDLEVRTGTTLGILGSNGCGKSTLLKTMARVLTPNRGSVEVSGTVSPLLELGTGFHPELTGRENLYLGGSLLGRTQRDIASKYDEIVEFAVMADFMDMPLKNYSSGMQARLAFALASSVDPEILLVDEVLSVGDERFQIRCHQRIAEFRAEGRTIVLVSHNLDTIRSLCSQAAWMENGIVRSAGPAHDVVGTYLVEVHGETDDRQSSPSLGSRYGNGHARITDVVLLDGDGVVADGFRTGETLRLRLNYQADDAVDDVCCGVAVHRADDLTHVFGQNTRQAGFPLTLSPEGMIEFTVPSLPLLPGRYVVTLALHDQGGKTVYDWHERRYPLLVSENPALPPGAGLVHVAGRWKMLTPPVAA
ncbi:MAG: ABC transporter ATP-binding protein [Actinomycetota bacterium]|nr:ABC transporter ATP-binding protein [Actinomycetota bacterium]